jgi:AcrR family transcriptional regulator
MSFMASPSIVCHCFGYMSMDRNHSPVKPKRRYDSRRREHRARTTRRAIVDAARDQFLSNGYAATTVASIASSAGVSVETVYKSFGGKPGLVSAVADAGLAGAGPVPAEVRSDELQRVETDPRAIIRGWGTLAAEVAPRVCPTLLLLRDASSDPEVAHVRGKLDSARLERMTHNARGLADAGHLRDDVSVEHAAEVMWTYSSPELYELLVVIRGWPVQRYGTFIAHAMVAALLPDSRSS